VSNKKHKAVGGTIGGILVGFDQQVFRTTPPAHELVVKGSPVRGLSGEDPKLKVVFPEDLEGDADAPSIETARAEIAPPDDPEAEAP
jgi:hypothetical protein